MTILQDKIDSLNKIGKDFDCELQLPPCGKYKDPFFYIKNIKDDVFKFREFLMEIKKVGVRHKFTEINGKIDYMRMLTEEV